MGIVAMNTLVRIFIGDDDAGEHQHPFLVADGTGWGFVYGERRWRYEPVLACKMDCHCHLFVPPVADARDGARRHCDLSVSTGISNMDPRPHSVVALNERITPSLGSVILFCTLTDVILAAYIPSAAPCW